MREKFEVTVLVKKRQNIGTHKDILIICIQKKSDGGLKSLVNIRLSIEEFANLLLNSCGGSFEAVFDPHLFIAPSSCCSTNFTCISSFVAILGFQGCEPLDAVGGKTWAT